MGLPDGCRLTPQQVIDVFAPFGIDVDITVVSGMDPLTAYLAISEDIQVTSSL